MQSATRSDLDELTARPVTIAGLAFAADVTS
jgi:hypothetical protein